MPNLSIFERELALYIRARFTLIVVVTREEERAVQSIQQVCQQRNLTAFCWDVADGLQPLVGNQSVGNRAADPLTALEQIEKKGQAALYVLKDFHDLWGNPRVRRKLRNLSQALKFTQKTVIVTTPHRQLPEELHDEAVIIDFLLPDSAEIDELLTTISKTPRVRVNLTPLGREKLVQAAVGLTTAQARRIFAKAIVRNNQLDDRDIDLVTHEKKQIIRESQALEFYSATETPDSVGGLDVLKNWLRMREHAFSQDARDYGLPAPKGIALIGIPGTGKSLTAKMVAGLWRLPLLRLDVGSLFGSLVGESEERTRRAIHLAETVAPCILWIDELEKAFAHGGSMDGGTSTRVFGTILTWMQEKTAPCFVVATANDVTALPPELLRKGRFDEIFFLDLPTFDERSEIFNVHLNKRHRIPTDYDVAALAAKADGYVGAEIEQAIIDAMYIGFNDNRREFDTADILHALARQIPLSISQRDRVDGLRSWLREGRVQSASFDEFDESDNQFVHLDLD